MTLLKGLRWRWGLRPPEALHYPISPTNNYLKILPNILYAIDYSGIKFYTCNDKEFTVCTQKGVLP